MTAGITLHTTVTKTPKIYAYSLPEVPKFNGWVKIGYTEGNVEKRIYQQTHTAGLNPKREWRGDAVFKDGLTTFRDTDFHAYLRRNNIEGQKGTEWFHITGPASEDMFNDFRFNRGHVKSLGVIPYTLRREQQEAVSKARDYFYLHKGGEFLWNAKPRFGKTLSVYELCKQLGATSVLILTNRPAIANSWLDDYNKFLGEESGYLFVSEVDTLKDKPGVYSRKDAGDFFVSHDGYRLIEFVSLQDLKGSLYFGGKIDKLHEVVKQDWDLLVIDEAHEGIDTEKTEFAFDKIHRKNTLHLSGTPFKALANAKFEEDAIFNWTYADEQRAKHEWNDEGEEQENPYQDLPQLNMFTYQMSEIIHDEVTKGMQIEGKSVDYAFDLNEFFSVKKVKTTELDGTIEEEYCFNHNDSVDKFLDALTTQEKFPFSTDELRNELKHSLWLLNRVESAKALAKKLQMHPVFKDYEIVVAAGDGKLDDEEENIKAYDKVKNAIKYHDKTITLSVGQLTTGVTIPEWSGVLMLSNVKSPALYMQAAFRAQNPCLFRNGAEFLRKQNAYVFDFDPARTLTIFEEFATSLNPGGDYTRQQRVRELLNFFPVIGEDENGEMVELDAAKVLSIPSKLKSQEVVRRGFMCDYLFQNISNIFRAPQAVMDILKKIPEGRKFEGPNPDNYKNIIIDANGDVSIPQEQVIGTTKDIFGKKIYKDLGPEITEIINKISPESKIEEIEQIGENLKTCFRDNVTKSFINTARENSKTTIAKSTQNTLERLLNNGFDADINRAINDHRYEQEKLKSEEKKAIESADTKEEAELLAEKFKTKQAENVQKFKGDAAEIFNNHKTDAPFEITETIEKQKIETIKRKDEDDIRKNLRGFSRTIPSFLMAYGSGNNITLMTLDKVIPENVFKEVTSITLEEFRTLRDGGDFTNTETGEKEHFDGHIFNQVVFDDSVKEFIDKKKALADYFNEGNKEDIFDYIPPQKTNQIFTPKVIVKKMVDMLEQENPGCFDDPEMTFIDLHMKSGLYITEIVKRLYNSPKIKAVYPDSKERLKHIFAKQVYGLAPTEIIYKITESYILGFDEKSHNITHNLRQADALPYAKKGELDKLLDKLYK